MKKLTNKEVYVLEDWFGCGTEEQTEITNELLTSINKWLKYNIGRAYKNKKEALTHLSDCVKDVGGFIKSFDYEELYGDRII